MFTFNFSGKEERAERNMFRNFYILISVEKKKELKGTCRKTFTF